MKKGHGTLKIPLLFFPPILPYIYLLRKHVTAAFFRITLLVLTVIALEAGMRASLGAKNVINMIIIWVLFLCHIFRVFFKGVVFTWWIFSIDWKIFIECEYANICSETLENTHPTYNYVNGLWLFIQLFTLVFAHAFICHIRGWRWCPESGRLSPQAVWTDNGRRPPHTPIAYTHSLQSYAASWPPQSKQWHMERDCFEEVHKKPYCTRASTHAHLWPLVQTNALLFPLCSAFCCNIFVKYRGPQLRWKSLSTG